MTPSIANKTLKLFRDHVPKTNMKDEYKLSRREKEVLKLLVEGLSYKMIADRCEISFETVKTYIKRIYEKLHVACMTEAVAKALLEHLL
jgi:DNA-binding NarL/FixJ family response regulator